MNLKLAKWNEPVAEGAALTVQFTHQGVEWGIIGTFGQGMGGGWTFMTGRASANVATDFNDTTGSFDAASATMKAAFPKNLFPHVDMNDTTLIGIKALSADLRTAYPYFVGGGAGAPLDGNGKWTLCDEGVASADYAFGSGHGNAHAAHMAGNVTSDANATATPTSATPAPGGSASAAAAGKDTPLAPLVLVAALVVAALARKLR